VVFKKFSRPGELLTEIISRWEAQKTLASLERSRQVARGRFNSADSTESFDAVCRRCKSLTNLVTNARLDRFWVRTKTEPQLRLADVAYKPRSFSIRERDIRRCEFAAVSLITFCSAALPTKFRILVVRHHHRYPSFGSRPSIGVMAEFKRVVAWSGLGFWAFHKTSRSTLCQRGEPHAVPLFCDLTRIDRTMPSEKQFVELRSRILHGARKLLR